jgi:hypothetical protein
MSISFTNVEFFIGPTGTLVGTINLTTTGGFTVYDTSGNQIGNYTLNVNQSGAIINGVLSPALSITIGTVTTSYDKISGTFKNLLTDHGSGTIHVAQNITGGEDPSWSAGGDEVGHPHRQKRAGHH